MQCNVSYKDKLCAICHQMKSFHSCDKKLKEVVKWHEVKDVKDVVQAHQRKISQMQ
jgi:hypothetical protein